MTAIEDTNAKEIERLSCELLMLKPCEPQDVQNIVADILYLHPPIVSIVCTAPVMEVMVR